MPRSAAYNRQEVKSTGGFSASLAKRAGTAQIIAIPPLTCKVWPVT